MTAVNIDWKILLLSEYVGPSWREIAEAFCAESFIRKIFD